MKVTGTPPLILNVDPSPFREALTKAKEKVDRFLTLRGSAPPREPVFYPGETDGDDRKS